MVINLNSAPTQNEYELLPNGPYCLRATVIAGGVGNDGTLRRGNKNKRQLMLEFSYKVVGGDYDGREIRDFPTVAIDDSTDGDLPPMTVEQRRSVGKQLRFGLMRLRAIIDSAHRLDPNDRSPEMEGKRSFETFDFFNGLQFYAHVGWQPGQGRFGPSNQVDSVIVLGDPDYPEETKAVAPRKSLAEDFDDSVNF